MCWKLRLQLRGVNWLGICRIVPFLFPIRLEKANEKICVKLLLPLKKVLQFKFFLKHAYQQKMIKYGKTNTLFKNTDGLVICSIIDHFFLFQEKPGQLWALREVRSLVCSFLHQVFIADPSLAKLVHFQVKCYCIQT